MVDLKENIGEGQIVVLVIPNEKYTKKIVDVARFFSETTNSLCYVSLNKLYNSLTVALTKEGIDHDNFLFMDGITKSANPQAEEADNCMYLKSSSNLTELSILLDRVMQSGKFDGFLFDSLSTILIYNQGEAVSKFTHDLINKIRAHNTTAVFTALEGDTKSDLLKEISMFVDGIVHLD
ncbi:hypothetical protein KAS08_03415 [Candidatus Pacearchaeota archaeon]|nr:hypothetical protein [Candidatus Pacearchaeota archaeon]